MSHLHLRVICAALLAAVPCLAQESRATLTGTVTDPQGAPIPAADVVAKQGATNLATKTTTNGAGIYVIPFLNTGTYTVTVTAKGFKTAVVNDVELNVSERRQLDVKLDLGALTESVTVSAAAELLDTADASRGTLFDSNKIADLPLLGKNTYTLAYQANGVLHINPQGSITDRPYDNGGMDAIRINGGQAFTNEYLLDGAPNTNVERGNVNSLTFVPPPEAVDEMAVRSNNYDAQYGRTGGGVISAVLKSGTNQIHGSAYEYYRSKILNANTWQGNFAGQPRGSFLWNQPGATANGPVYIPKIYDGRNKTFFLFSWEGIYQNIPNYLLQTVPTAAMRQGDFSGLHTSSGQPITIYDPTTTQLAGSNYIRTPFGGNKIPQNRWDPVALKLMQYMPQPNFPADASGFNNYSPSGPGTLTLERYNAYTIKFDQVITQNERFSIHYVTNKRWQTGPYYGWQIPALGPNNFERYNQGANAQLTSTLSPTMVVTTRFGFTEHIFLNYMNGGGFDPTQLGFPAGQVAQAQGKFFPQITMTNYTGFGQAGNNSDTSTNWYFTSVANKSLGRHSIKFGGEYRVFFDNLPNYSFANFGFTNAWTQRDALNADALSGNAFASFLLGYANSGASPYNASPAFGYHSAGLFVQDDIRITDKLTVNLGGRFEYESPITERYNRENAGFDLTGPSNLQVPGLALTGGLLFTSSDNRLPWKRDVNNIDPRLGVAYHFLPKTVFRAGYGMSYVPTYISPQTQGFSTSTPFVSSLDGGLTPSGVLSNPFPSGTIKPSGSSLGFATFAGQGVTYAYQGRTIPYIHQFSAGFQQELPASTVLDVSYVGSRTRELATSKNINSLTAAQLALGQPYLTAQVANPFAGLLPGTTINGATVQRQQLLLPYPQFTSVTRTGFPNGRAWYNSLQVQVQKRLTHGFHLLVDYTYSETMQAVSYLNPQFGDNQLESVRASEDLPHRLSIVGGYQIPLFHNSRRLVKTAFGGWQVQLIALFQSGRQLAGVDAYPTGANQFVDGPYNPNGYYFNGCTLNTNGVRQNCASATQAAAWIQRPAGTLRVDGTQWSQRREMRPGVMDSSIFKSFPLHERLTFQLRMEAFNTFNTPWFGLANTSLGNARFGLMGNTQGNDPRNVQVAGKLNW
ncbi:MAG TPA: TonB-dependent receptor [Candidatus Limnocylindrales bacterium]|nr:TonB-dependent receptor [Candidatus Limnocylindrales bacterium]